MSITVTMERERSFKNKTPAQNGVLYRLRGGG